VRIERFAGLLTAFLGVGGAVLALFAPVNSNQECTATAEGASTCTSWSTSLWQDNHGAATTVLAIVTTVVLLVGASALADSQSAKRPRLLLVSATAVLSLLTFVTMFSVGVFILPATLAALVASIAALLRRGRTAAAT
jgi:hypothetical protein